jgi:hypothetical protein
MNDLIVLIIYAVLSGFGVWYLTESLVYDFNDEDNNTGPFKSPKHYVYNGLTNQSRIVNLFDTIRVLFGFYMVETKGDEQIWNLKLDKSTSAWACVHCFSIWLSLVFMVLFYNYLPLSQQILVALTAAGISSFLSRRSSYALSQVWGEESETEFEDE